MKLRSKELLRAVIGPEPGKKMSARRLADFTKLHPSFIDHLMAGRRSSCTPDTAERIAEVLGVPVEFLFDVRLSTTEQISGKGRAA